MRLTATKTIGAGNRRYIGWFLAAGWDPAEVAALFDVDAQALLWAFDLG